MEIVGLNRSFFHFLYSNSELLRYQKLNNDQSQSVFLELENFIFTKLSAVETCVLCGQCIFESQHKNHDYKILSSVRGGICDCGDIALWTTFPSCSFHGGCETEASSSTLPIDNYICKEEVEKATNQLPIMMKYRFLLLIEQIFYQFKLFVILPICKVNDEMRLRELEHETTCVELEYDSILPTLKNFILDTLQWLYEFANHHPLFRLVLCQHLLQDVQIANIRLFDKSTFIQDIFENPFDTWKLARNVCSNFLISVILKETYFKRLFAIQFVKKQLNESRTDTVEGVLSCLVYRQLARDMETFTTLNARVKKQELESKKANLKIKSLNEENVEIRSNFHELTLKSLRFHSKLKSLMDTELTKSAVNADLLKEKDADTANNNILTLSEDRDVDDKNTCLASYWKGNVGSIFHSTPKIHRKEKTNAKSHNVCSNSSSLHFSRSEVLLEPSNDLLCILCKKPSDDRPSLVIAGAWRSSVLAKHPFTSQSLNITESDEDHRCGKTLNDTEELIPSTTHDSFSDEESDNCGGIDRIVVRNVVRTTLPILDHPEETFITTCGHVMHYDCKTRYMNNMFKQKQRAKGVSCPRIYNRCPQCKWVCNIDIPIIKQEDIPNDGGTETMSLEDWTNYFVNWTKEIKIDDIDSYTLLDKLMLKKTIPFKHSQTDASNDDLLSSLAFKVGVAIKRHPAKLNTESYSAYGTDDESTLADIVKLDYAVAYTLSVWEQILSKRGLSLVTDMSAQQAIGLNLLIKAVKKSHEKLSDYKYLILLQQVLFQYPYLVPKEFYNLHRRRIPVFLLEIDFTFLVTTLLFMRSSFNKGRQCEELSKFFGMTNYNMNAVRMIFEFVSLQALLSLQVTKDENINDNFDELRSYGADLWTKEIIDGLYRLREALSQRLPQLSMTPLTQQQVVVYFTRAVMPYLRCASFLLMALGSIEQIETTFENGSVEYNYLFQLLGLSLLPSQVNHLPVYLLEHLHYIVDNRPHQIQSICGTKLPHLLPHAPPKLIDLPLQFTDLLTLYRDRGCSLCQRAMNVAYNKTLCLFCGDTFCSDSNYYYRPPVKSSLISWASCAMIHARQCHSGYTIFQNSHDSNILAMVYNGRWMLDLDPIYLDVFGERDIDIKKDNPLFLNRDVYAKLQTSWLDHSVCCVVDDGLVTDDYFG